MSRANVTCTGSDYEKHEDLVEESSRSISTLTHKPIFIMSNWWDLRIRHCTIVRLVLLTIGSLEVENGISSVVEQKILYLSFN